MIADALALSEWDFYSAQNIPPRVSGAHETVVIHALEYSITQDSIADTEGLLIYADKVYIRGRFSHPTCSLFINARVLVFLPGSVVDVSGSDALPTLSPRWRCGTSENKLGVSFSVNA